MAHYVTVKPHDLETLIQITEQVLIYKEQALSTLSWHRFETKYLPSLLQSLKQNMFKHVRSDDNIALWLLDQICHSRKIIQGVSHKEGIPLIDTALGQEAAALLRAMSKGQISYDQYRSTNNFSNLFEIDK